VIFCKYPKQRVPVAHAPHLKPPLIGAALENSRTQDAQAYILQRRRAKPRLRFDCLCRTRGSADERTPTKEQRRPDGKVNTDRTGSVHGRIHNGFFGSVVPIHLLDDLALTCDQYSVGKNQYLR
jgi:hypothetical protein